MIKFEKSELILNNDGTIFHLHLQPENIADTIILVGDQGRVKVVSDFFDKIEFKAANREFITHTGTFRGQRITALSTGIGTDNIDIVVNELDALVNIDLKKRMLKPEHHALNLIRIGTSGALQGDIPVDTPIATATSIGFDGMLNFYAAVKLMGNEDLKKAFLEHTQWRSGLPIPYFPDASQELLNKVAGDMRQGMTISAPGFYGPQGRMLRLPLRDATLNDKISKFEYNGRKITNYEMESSAIYGLSKALGHNALTVCNIIANRIRKEYSKDYKPGVKNLIEKVLVRLTD